ncbi:hypothetical protein DLM_0805 [Aquitalea magnusonii]|uniref:Uncharacterized protein n=1 Tax=Aquitalea magnusonii TaxID=332411 RepID=A0A3G9GEC9_9NEIS|nr:hypothetical protein DLM_0805 [Aquitalea magnusonii]
MHRAAHVPGQQDRPDREVFVVTNRHRQSNPVIAEPVIIAQGRR